jgi:hypothetical protein
MVRPEGHPSITTPKPTPCDSPKVLILNMFPKVLPAMWVKIKSKLNLVKGSLLILCFLKKFKH